MKKAFYAVCFLAIFFCAAPMAFATTSSSQTLGDTSLTIPVTNVPATSVTFSFDTSPNVDMAVRTSDTAFAITCTNTLTSPSNGNDYGTVNSATGYAIRTKVEAASVAVTAPSDENNLPGSDWAWQGGSGS